MQPQNIHAALLLALVYVYKSERLLPFHRRTAHTCTFAVNCTLHTHLLGCSFVLIARALFFIFFSSVSFLFAYFSFEWFSINKITQLKFAHIKTVKPFDSFALFRIKSARFVNGALFFYLWLSFLSRIFFAINLVAPVSDSVLIWSLKKNLLISIKNFCILLSKEKEI